MHIHSSSDQKWLEEVDTILASAKANGGSEDEWDRAKKLLEALQVRAVELCDDMDARGLATVMWALAKWYASDVDCGTNEALLVSLQRRALEVVDVSTSQDVGNSLWALGTLRSSSHWKGCRRHCPRHEA